MTTQFDFLDDQIAGLLKEFSEINCEESCATELGKMAPPLALQNTTQKKTLEGVS